MNTNARICRRSFLGVIGAGVAGRTVGSALTTAGLETVALEGRGRLGRRVWPDEVDGVSVDLGGMWTHGPTGTAAASLLNHEAVGLESAEFYGPDTRAFGAIAQRDPIDERIGPVTVLSDFYDAMPLLVQSLGLSATMAGATTAFLDQPGFVEPARLLGREGRGAVLDSGLLVAPDCNEEA